MNRPAILTVIANLSSAIPKLVFAVLALIFIICNRDTPPVLAYDDLYAAYDSSWQTSVAGLIPPKIREPFDKDRWQKWMQADPNAIRQREIADFFKPRPVLDTVYRHRSPLSVERPNDLNVRLKERTDFLQSYPVIGMKREEILSLLGPPSASPKPAERDGIVDYYQLSYSHNQITPILFLEFRYSNGRVCAFRTEHIVPAIPTAEKFGKQVPY